MERSELIEKCYRHRANESEVMHPRTLKVSKQKNFDRCDLEEMFTAQLADMYRQYCAWKGES